MEQEESCTFLSILHVRCCLCLFSRDRSCRKVGLKCRSSSNRECAAEWRPRYHQISQSPLSLKLVYSRDTTVHTRGALHCVATYVMFPNVVEIVRIGRRFKLTPILLTWIIWWDPTNDSKWQMGFNSVFKGLKKIVHVPKFRIFLISIPLFCESLVV